MSGYDEKSCSVLEKPYYKPIEAALRWCGLIEHETAILQKTGKAVVPPADAFPQWPCLRANAEKIYEATETGELPGYRDGRSVDNNGSAQTARKSLFPNSNSANVRPDPISKERLTVKHTELRVWMAKHYPDQKPAFLFDETERTTHQAINADSFTALQVDRDAIQVQLATATADLGTLRQSLAAISKERDKLANKVANGVPAHPRSETAYLNTIGVLLEFIQTPKPERDSEAKIIQEMVLNYSDKPGISERNLQSYFAAAKRSLLTP